MKSASKSHPPKFRLCGPLKARLAVHFSRPQIIAVRHRVTNPESLANQFKLGDRVLYLHFDATTKRDMLHLIRLFGQKIPDLKSRGFVGVYGDSQNTALIKKLQKKFGGVLTKTPKEIEIEIRKRYNRFVQHSIYPAKYANAAVERLVIPFW
ncbi:MAG: hypothetical protein HYW50_05030 [Candidatus Diapherotrites archaeon]|nr:hypothetical protein [Candidatus Diapherotrites archaeon]